MSTELTFNPSCTKCGRKMGVITSEEMAALILAEGEHGKCLACDPDGALAYPVLFQKWIPGDIFVLDDKSFEVVSGAGFPEFLIEVSHTHMRMRARACLSSSTYLNTLLKKGVEIQTEKDTHWPCSECANGWLWPKENGWNCDRCAYFGPKVRAMILPDWILTSEEDRKITAFEAAFCDHCLEVQLGGYGKFCAYHHALLTEQSEDGLMGVGNE